MAVHLLDFPAPQVPSWTTNPIESTYCLPVRLRTHEPKGAAHGSRLTMVFISKLGIRKPRNIGAAQRIRFAPKRWVRGRPFYRWIGTARTSLLKPFINRGCAFFPYTLFDNSSKTNFPPLCTALPKRMEPSSKEPILTVGVLLERGNPNWSWEQVSLHVLSERFTTIYNVLPRGTPAVIAYHECNRLLPG